MQCSAAWCSAASAVRCSAVQCSAVRLYIVDRLSICDQVTDEGTCSTVQCSGVQYSAVHPLQGPLGRLSLASRPAFHLAVAWVASPSGLRRLAHHINSAADSEARLQLWLALCHQLGMFYKRATMLQHSGARLAELAACYNSLERLGCAGLADPWAKVCGRAGLAAALHALALGWDESEYPGIYRLLEGRHPALARLPGLRVRVLLQGEDQGELAELRALLRIFFWEFAPDEVTRAGWLAFLLNRAADAS